MVIETRDARGGASICKDELPSRVLLVGRGEDDHCCVDVMACRLGGWVLFSRVSELAMEADENLSATKADGV